MTSPFKLIDLPCGDWAVAWGDNLDDDTVIRGPQTLDIIFNDMRLTEARLGILIGSGQMETLGIDSEAYWQHGSRAQDMVSMYVVAGAVFDTEALARQFQTIAEQQYLLSVLKS